MKIYTIDQLNENAIAAIQVHLHDMNFQSGLDGVYWLPIPDGMLTSVQREHLKQCGPYGLALEVEDSAIHMELLVRGMGCLHCHCLSFASETLRNHMIAYLENILADLNLLL